MTTSPAECLRAPIRLGSRFKLALAILFYFLFLLFCSVVKDSQEQSVFFFLESMKKPFSCLFTLMNCYYYCYLVLILFLLLLLYCCCFVVIASLLLLRCCCCFFLRVFLSFFVHFCCLSAFYHLTAAPNSVLKFPSCHILLPYES